MLTGLPVLKELKTQESFGLSDASSPLDFKADPNADSSSSLWLAAATSQTPRIQHVVRSLARQASVEEHLLLSALKNAFGGTIGGDVDWSAFFTVMTVDSIQRAVSSACVPAAASSSSSSSASASTIPRLSELKPALDSLKGMAEHVLHLTVDTAGSLGCEDSLLVSLLATLPSAMGSSAAIVPKTLNELRKQLADELLCPQREPFYFGFFEDKTKVRFSRAELKF